jgi:hypothetical protein
LYGEDRVDFADELHANGQGGFCDGAAELEISLVLSSSLFRAIFRNDSAS